MKATKSAKAVVSAERSHDAVCKRLEMLTGGCVTVIHTPDDYLNSDDPKRARGHLYAGWLSAAMDNDGNVAALGEWWFDGYRHLDNLVYVQISTGVGGGFVILPALVLLAGLEMKAAIGTSLAVIDVNSFACLLGQLHYVQFDWPITLGFLVAALAGMGGASAVASRISSQSLRRAFAGSIIVLGIFLLAKNTWL